MKVSKKWIEQTYIKTEIQSEISSSQVSFCIPKIDSARSPNTPERKNNKVDIDVKELMNNKIFTESHQKHKVFKRAVTNRPAEKLSKFLSVNIQKMILKSTMQLKVWIKHSLALKSRSGTWMILMSWATFSTARRLIFWHRSTCQRPLNSQVLTQAKASAASSSKMKFGQLPV